MILYSCILVYIMNDNFMYCGYTEVNVSRWRVIKFFIELIAHFRWFLVVTTDANGNHHQRTNLPVCFQNPALNTLRPRQNGPHFADDIFKCIFLNENVWILLKISLKFVPKVPINYIPALVLIMPWHRPGDKPLSEPMMVRLPTHICVTRPQWVNQSQLLRCDRMQFVRHLLESVEQHFSNHYQRLCIDFMHGRTMTKWLDATCWKAEIQVATKLLSNTLVLPIIYMSWVRKIFNVKIKNGWLFHIYLHVL